MAAEDVYAAVCAGSLASAVGVGPFTIDGQMLPFRNLLLAVFAKGLQNVVQVRERPPAPSDSSEAQHAL